MTTEISVMYGSEKVKWFIIMQNSMVYNENCFMHYTNSAEENVIMSKEHNYIFTVIYDVVKV